jgi:hypothetical protein
LFEITGEDIAALSDEDLRTLVGRLCEADLSRWGIANAAVTWGGDQNAADGGIDVRVNFAPRTVIDGMPTRPSVGFQVKCHDMPRKEIIKEMRPNGRFRASIRDLAGCSGAYIIVSSRGSVSDSALKARRKAMTDAIPKATLREALALDFYDRSRVATWVRPHPGLIAWVKERTGKALPGWRPYGAWAFVPEGAATAFLADDQARIRHPGESEPLPVLEGLRRVREVLRQPRRVARLVGLSGTGKTRFVQALFETGVDSEALDPSLALYTDVANTPEPHPTKLVADLVAARTRAIVVVDNCPPDLHRRLTESCCTTGSTVSVITVEYDISDDQPEETQVFKLEPASTALVERLLRARFGNISQVDAATAAEFSGGNARVAIALASTIGQRSSLAGLSDAELFRRLFHQRTQPNEPLMRAAEACALVYSFQGTDVKGADAELPTLGDLIGMTGARMFRYVAELQRRDLVQQRDVWRAVLPHAIANRLAALALSSIPPSKISDAFNDAASPRLLRSFSRRLGYLHKSVEAVQIAEDWLSPNGLLGDIGSLDQNGRTMFENVAPTAPMATLQAIERGIAAVPQLANSREIVHLLRSLAYDASVFDQAADLLAQLAEARVDGAVDAFTGLFSIYLSGTHASVDQRLRRLRTMIESGPAAQRTLGFLALDAMLKTDYFSAAHAFDFGSWSRDYGSQPETEEGILAWFQPCLDLLEVLTSAFGPLASRAAELFSTNFRGLWGIFPAHDQLERICASISARGHWREGWLAARETLNFDGSSMPDDVRCRLQTLERSLRPRELADKVRSLVFGHADAVLLDEPGDLDAENFAITYERANRTARELGVETARNPVALAELLPEMCINDGRLYLFGQGLSDGATDPADLWNQLLAAYTTAPSRARNIQPLRGFLNVLGGSNPTLAGDILDAAVEHEAVGLVFPMLQSAVEIDRQGIDRLTRSLNLGDAPIGEFRSLSWGGFLQEVQAATLIGLLDAIGRRDDGPLIAIEILHMRLAANVRNEPRIDPGLIEVGRRLLSAVALGDDTRSEDHRLAVIARVCLPGPSGGSIATELCRKLDAMSWFRHRELFASLMRVQPLTMLDELFSGSEIDRRSASRFLNMGTALRHQPLDQISDDTIIEWCQVQPDVRFQIMAGLVSFRRAGGLPAWTNIALRLLQEAPDRVAVLQEFVRRLRPVTWSGSRADIMESNAPLLEFLKAHPDPQIRAYIPEAEEDLRRSVEAARAQERQWERERDQRFEP